MSKPYSVYAFPRDEVRIVPSASTVPGGSLLFQAVDLTAAAEKLARYSVLVAQGASHLAAIHIVSKGAK